MFEGERVVLKRRMPVRLRRIPAVSRVGQEREIGKLEAFDQSSGAGLGRRCGALRKRCVNCRCRQKGKESAGREQIG